MSIRLIFLFIIGIGAMKNFAIAEESSDLVKLKSELNTLKETIKKLNISLEEQERKIEELVRKQSTENIKPNQKAALPSYTTPYIPDIGAVADTVVIATENGEDEEGNDSLSLRAFELILGHDVDPFSRLDATISFSELEEASLEEAYLTHWGLPYSFKARIGRFSPKIGIAPSIHRDSLDTIDEPLVVQQFFGEEGYKRSGIELSYFLPEYFDGLTQEFISGILEGGVGEGANLFADNKRTPTIYFRIKNSFDLSENTLINIGTSFLSGSADDDSDLETKAVSFDFLINNQLNAINKIKFQTEVYLQDRSLADFNNVELENTPNDQKFNRSPIGLYSLIDYRLSESWGLGIRYDYIEAVNIIKEIYRNSENSYSAYLTFYQSEFARFRAQYQHARLYNGDNDDRLLLQMTVAIGTHKHNIQ